MSADLITLDEFLKALGKPPGDVEQIDNYKYKTAITGASQTIRDYCDRDFILTADATQGPRQFRYYGSGLLEIDDSTDISQLDVTATPWSPYTRTLRSSEWVAGPMEKTVKSYVELWTTLPFPDSPEMGFQWNADRYSLIPRPIIFTVTAVWGWPEIPAPVKSACILVANEMAIAETPYTAESIEGYSHTFGAGRSASAVPQTAINVRAESLLDPYLRVNA